MEPFLDVSGRSFDNFLRIILSNNTLSHAGIDFKHSTCVLQALSMT